LRDVRRIPVGPHDSFLRVCLAVAVHGRSRRDGRHVGIRAADARHDFREANVKQPLTEVRGFILRSKQTLQNSPNMPELYTRAKAPGPTYFLVGLHRLLDRAERVNVLCRTSTTGRLAPTIPRYSAEPPCVDRDTRDRQQGSAIPPLTVVRGFLAEMSMKLMNGRRPVHPGEVLRDRKS